MGLRTTYILATILLCGFLAGCRTTYILATILLGEIKKTPPSVPRY